MAYTKKEISNALETITAPGEGTNLIESGAVKNIVTFDKEVIVDVTIGNPTLQAKKKMEVEIMNSKYYCNCFRKRWCREIYHYRKYCYFIAKNGF